MAKALLRKNLLYEITVYELSFENMQLDIICHIAVSNTTLKICISGYHHWLLDLCYSLGCSSVTCYEAPSSVKTPEEMLQRSFCEKEE